MAQIGYSAPPETEVGFVTPRGEAKTIKFSKGGSYTTSDDDEITALDAVAELKAHPISFAPKFSAKE